MTSTPARPVGSSSTEIVHRGEAGVGPFMLTLCRLVEPVSIRPPQSPRLRPFTFFTSRARQRDGSEQLCLHMGFFETFASAEKWARAVRGRHPDAVATLAPSSFWQALDSGSAASSVASRGALPDSRHFAPVENSSLTDTQVLNILEVRRLAQAQNSAVEPGVEQIELLRPEDTGIRRALKEAVVQGAPVAFAVQLHWSARPIDCNGLAELPVLKPYTLYTVESRRANRSCFFLRLGFFADPISAKQVAFAVRSSFASAAVVPVLDEEVACAREACVHTSTVPCLVQERLDQADGADAAAGGVPVLEPAGRSGRAFSQGVETLEQTLARLAERELWNDPDVLSDTGVRHLKVEVEKRTPGRRH